MQLYTVHALVNGALVPCLYALLQWKDKATYIHMWQYIRQVALALGIILDPASVLIDFEEVAWNAIQRQFHKVRVAGCFFHLGQLVWCHLCQEGQRAIYLEEANFQMHVKMMTCTSFLPMDRVTAGFEALQESPEYDPCMDVIFDFFEDNYVGGVLRNGNRCAPLFAIDMWNTLIRLEEGVPNTNNAVEGWHSAFQGSLQGAHLTVWKLSEAFQREETLQQVCYQGICASELQSRKHKYVALSAWIRNIVEDRGNRPVLEH